MQHYMLVRDTMIEYPGGAWVPAKDADAEIAALKAVQMVLLEWCHGYQSGNLPIEQILYAAEAEARRRAGKE